jgi:hypothetical protein
MEQISERVEDFERTYLLLRGARGLLRTYRSHCEEEERRWVWHKRSEMDDENGWGTNRLLAGSSTSNYAHKEGL